MTTGVPCRARPAPSPHRRPPSWLTRAIAGAYSAGSGIYETAITRGARMFRVGREALDGIGALVEDLGADDAPVLDVPTGTGVWLGALPRAVIGADLAPGMLARARRAHPDVPLVRADVFALPFADRSLGAVVSALGFHLFPRPGGAAAEIHRALRPGGSLRLAVPLGISPYLPAPSSVRRMVTRAGFEIEHAELRHGLVLIRAHANHGTQDARGRTT